ncbi:hypothetical protein ACFO0N_12545 [Halobium salinum]|uniref:DUF7315 domain-containing protein n=1 Tax=Halobium salinum TaxID=1364940 RepID=A0ABD5PCZ8_9EURY|nr:hypothetical protein [Halobium salinum]
MSTDPSSESSAPGTAGGEAAAGEASGDEPAADETPDDEVSGPSGRGRRDVVVPMRVYKTVTVFSTLIAVVAVVLGFVLIDAATLGVSFLRSFVVFLLSAVGLSVPGDVLSAVLAALGLLVIAAGAGVYVLGTRFRAGGMGNSQEDSGEGFDNG